MVKSATLWLIKIGLFITPFIPLYVSKVLFFPFITGKAFVFRTIVEIVFAAWIFLAIFYKEYRPRKSALLVALSIFIVVVALATIFGANPYKSFWSNFERMEGLVSYLHLFAYFLVLGQVFRKNDWPIFFNLFVASGIIESIYAWFQRFGYIASLQGGIGRPDGTIGNPTYLAAYLIFILFFCLYLLFNSRYLESKIFYGVVSLFILATIYLTASRGPGLAIIAGGILGSILYLLFNRSAENAKYRKIALAVLAFFILAPAAFWTAKDTNFVRGNPTLSRLTLLSLKERTVASRFVIWQMGWEGFKEHPILGWGPENYELVFSKYFKPVLWQQEPWFDRSHNIIFDWLINAGILGLMSYLGIFVSALYLLWTGYKKNIFSPGNAILVFVLFFAYFFQNLFVFDNSSTYMGFFAVLAFIYSSTREPDISESRSIELWPFPRGYSGPSVVASGLLIPLIAIIYFINMRPLLANLSLLDALKIQSTGNYTGAFEQYQKALDYNTLGSKETREQLARFSLNVGGMESVPADFRDKILRTALGEAQKSVMENPMDPRAYIFLSGIFGGVGFNDQALAVLNKAAELSPAKQQIYFELGDIYIRKGDYANAVKVLEKAYNLDNEFDRAAMNLAAAYIINSQQQKADDLLIGFAGKTDVPEIILAQAYSRVKNYGRLAGIWKALAETSVSDVQYWKNAAGAYLLMGAKSEAIKILERAISLNPGFKGEAESLIEDILSQ